MRPGRSDPGASDTPLAALGWGVYTMPRVDPIGGEWAGGCVTILAIVPTIAVDPDEIHARIAAQIRRRASAKGLTLRGVAEATGTGSTHLWAVLGGRRSPTVTWLCRVAQLLECDPADLLRVSKAR